MEILNLILGEKQQHKLYFCRSFVSETAVDEPNGIARIKREIWLLVLAMMERWNENAGGAFMIR